MSYLPIVKIQKMLYFKTYSLFKNIIIKDFVNIFLYCKKELKTMKLNKYV